MKKIVIILVMVSLLVMACQKEEVKPSGVMYISTDVNAIDDSGCSEYANKEYMTQEEVKFVLENCVS